MKKLYSLIASVAVSLICGANVAAQDRVTLVDIDFSTWEDQQICAGSTNQETVNGITFYAKNNSKQYDIADGVMTWVNNNYSSGSYLIGIPLKDINSKIYLSVWNGEEKTRVTYCWKGGATDFVTNPGSGTSTSSDAPTVATIDAGSNTFGWLYLGRQGSGLTKCTRILVETDAPAKSEVSSVTSITGVTINGEAISADNLAALVADKSLSLSESYFVAPAVVFATNTHILYDDESEEDKAGTVEATVVGGEGNTFVATATVGEVDYTITMNKSVEAALEANPAAVTLESVRIMAGTATIHVTGANLSGDAVTITLPDVEGLTCDKTSLPITEGSVSADIVLTYQSNDDVAEATAGVTLTAGETSVTVPVTYSSTAAVTETTLVRSETVWNWDGAYTTQTQLGDGLKNTDVVLGNWTGWAAGFNADALMVNGEYIYRTSSVKKPCFQGYYIEFDIEKQGDITVKFSNTGSKNGTRTVYINEEALGGSTSTDISQELTLENVPAGKVKIWAKQTVQGDNATPAEGDAAPIRIYYIKYGFATDGVESVAVDAENVAPVYYNLQGVRVAQPTNGAYIVVRGSKVSKEFIR